jgi:hypothetical protein
MVPSSTLIRRQTHSSEIGSKNYCMELSNGLDDSIGQQCGAAMSGMAEI